MSAEKQNGETFIIQEDFGIIRESDGEVMANYDAEKDELTYTHHSRETNYGPQIRALVDEMKADPNAPEEQVQEKDSSSPDGGPRPDENEEGKEEKTDPNYQENHPRGQRDPIDLPSGEPEPHPQLGRYSREHLLYDHKSLEDGDFLKKWGGRMTLSTTRNLEKNARMFGEHAEEIKKRISK